MDESKGQAGGVLTPVAMSRESRAMLLNVLWHHQGGSSPVGQPLRKLLGIEQHAHLTGQELSEAKWIDKALVDGTRPTPAAAALGDTRQFSNLSNQAHGFASPAAAAGVPTGGEKAKLDAMVDRFLGWRLPDTFGPDCFVAFDRERAKANQSWPVGTNLLTATEARAMLEHVLGESFWPDWSLLEASRASLREHQAMIRELRATGPVAPDGAPTRRLEELIAKYWTLAYAEGKEGRDHDTEGGAAQQCWHEIKDAIALLSAGSQGEQHDSSHEAAPQSSAPTASPLSSLPETDGSALPREPWPEGAVFTDAEGGYYDWNGEPLKGQQ